MEIVIYISLLTSYVTGEGMYKGDMTEEAANDNQKEKEERRRSIGEFSNSFKKRMNI